MKHSLFYFTCDFLSYDLPKLIWVYLTHRYYYLYYEYHKTISIENIVNTKYEELQNFLNKISIILFWKHILAPLTVKKNVLTFSPVIIIY